MAELNFGLLTPPGSQSIGNAFVQGMDQAAVARAQENQNALSQYTLSKARREDEVNNRLLSDLRAAKTPEEQMQAYVYAGRAKDALAMQSDMLKIAKTRGEILAQPGAQANTQAQTAVRYGTVMKNEATRVLADPTFDNAMRAVVNFGKATGQDVTQELATITAMGNDPVKIANWAKGHAVTGEQLLNQSKPPDVARLIEYRNSLPEGADRNAVTAMIEKASNENYQYNSNTGKFERRQGDGAAPASRAFVDSGIPQGVTPQMQMSNADEARLQARAMNAAGMPVNIRVGGNALVGAQPQPQPQPPDVNALRAQPAAATTTAPLNPREKLEDFQAVLALEKLGYRRTPEGNFEKISGGPADKTVVTRTPVQELKFRKDLATDYTMVTATAQATQDLIDSITDVKNSPGLAGATGISGMVYSFPGSQAAAAQTNLANLKGKVTLLGKALASADGKIGPMAVQEWTIVRDMVAALDTAVSKGEKITLDEIGKIEFAAKNVAKRVQDKFEGQYGDELSNYPQFATVPEPKSRLSGKIKPAGGGSVTAPKTPTVNIDALLKKYE